jgi:hypothetical protein
VAVHHQVIARNEDATEHFVVDFAVQDYFVLVQVEDFNVGCLSDFAEWLQDHQQHHLGPVDLEILEIKLLRFVLDHHLRGVSSVCNLNFDNL